MMDLQETLRVIAEHQGNAVVITTMSTAKVWPLVSNKEELNLPLRGCMGKASSIGLGLALARPDVKVIVLDGDGSLLMNLGSLVTIANMGPKNLYHFVFENQVYQLTGGQPIPGRGRRDFTAMARAAGFSRTHDFGDIESFAREASKVLGEEGPVFVCLKIRSGGKLPPFPRRNTPEAMQEVKAALAKAG